jgi:hypothetical protein
LHKILSLGIAVTEIVLEGPRPEALAELRPHTTSVVRTGDRVRLEISDESEVPKVLDITLRHSVKIVSLNPVKRSLEDYFLEQVATPAANSRENVTTPQAG